MCNSKSILIQLGKLIYIGILLKYYLIKIYALIIQAERFTKYFRTLINYKVLSGWIVQLIKTVCDLKLQLHDY